MMQRHRLHRGAILRMSLVVLLAASSSAARADPGADSKAWAFFAFDNGVGRDEGWSPNRQAATLKRIGYSGIGYSGARDLESRSLACRRHSLRIISLYEPFRVEAENPISASVLSQLPLIGNAGAVLWIHLVGEALEEKVVKDLRALADRAEQHGVRVAIYPHAGVYVETASHALRLVEQVDRENLGLSINLCHELRAGNADELPRLVRETREHLFLVSINGADRVEDARREHGWTRLIQPLGQGDLDLLPLLRELRRAGYEGPVGLQCYRLEGDPEVILREARLAWQEILDMLAAEGS